MVSVVAISSAVDETSWIRDFEAKISKPVGISVGAGEDGGVVSSVSTSEVPDSDGEEVSDPCVSLPTFPKGGGDWGNWL